MVVVVVVLTPGRVLEEVVASPGRVVVVVEVVVTPGRVEEVVVTPGSVVVVVVVTGITVGMHPQLNGRIPNPVVR